MVSGYGGHCRSYEKALHVSHDSWAKFNRKRKSTMLWAVNKFLKCYTYKNFTKSYIQNDLLLSYYVKGEKKREDNECYYVIGQTLISPHFVSNFLLNFWMHNISLFIFYKI